MLLCVDQKGATYQTTWASSEEASMVGPVNSETKCNHIGRSDLNIQIPNQKQVTSWACNFLDKGHSLP